MIGAPTDTLPDLLHLDALEAYCRKTIVPAEGERLVFGEGPAGARLMLVGEAPGAEEAKTGRRSSAMPAGC